MEGAEEGDWRIHLMGGVVAGLEGRLLWSGTRYRRQ